MHFHLVYFVTVFMYGCFSSFEQTNVVDFCLDMNLCLWKPHVAWEPLPIGKKKPSGKHFRYSILGVHCVRAAQSCGTFHSGGEPYSSGVGHETAMPRSLPGKESEDGSPLTEPCARRQWAMALVYFGNYK